MNVEREGPYEGSRCMAYIGGLWFPSIIKRVNEDGTFNSERAESQSIFLNVSYGMTAAEFIFNDRDFWQRALELITESSEMSGPVFGFEDLKKAARLSKLSGRPGVIEKYWDNYCRDKAKLSEEPAGARLNADTAYHLITTLGMSAKVIVGGEVTFNHGGAYSNSCRLGGRDPAEIARAVTLQDALCAWGLEDAPDDPESLAAVSTLEAKHQVRIPETLRAIVCKQGLPDTMIDAHCLAPELWAFCQEDFRLAPDDSGMDGTYVWRVVVRMEYEWYAAFSDNDSDARIYFKRELRQLPDGGDDEYDEPETKYLWNLTAPTSTMFFWDLAQTSLVWYQCNNKENLDFPKTDIGLRMPAMTAQRLRQRRQESRR